MYIMRTYFCENKTYKCVKINDHEKDGHTAGSYDGKLVWRNLVPYIQWHWLTACGKHTHAPPPFFFQEKLGKVFKRQLNYN